MCQTQLSESTAAVAYEILNKIEITLIVWGDPARHTLHPTPGLSMGVCVCVCQHLLRQLTHTATHTHRDQKAKTISEFDAQILVANVTVNAVPPGGEGGDSVACMCVRVCSTNWEHCECS